MMESQCKRFLLMRHASECSFAFPLEILLCFPRWSEAEREPGRGYSSQSP